MKKKAIIIDLDGTLSDCSHRRHHAEKGDFKEFYKTMGDDPVNEWCRAIIDSFKGTHKVLIVSGRPDEYDAISRAWMIFNDIHFDELYMRLKGDFRDDTIIKKSIFHYYIEHEYEIEFVIDDRKKVIEMWRKLGLTALQCAEGNF